MPILITDNARFFLAEMFYFSLQSAATNENMYLFVGQQTPWNDDALPPIPQQGLMSYKTVWQNMIAGKKLTPQNISLVIPRIDWASGQVYTAYTDDDVQPIDSEQLYVVNTSVNPYRVYKCLANNATWSNGVMVANSPSTVAPTTTSTTTPQTTSDGYKWKFMYSINLSDQFLNSKWIPVPLIPAAGSDQDLVAKAAVDGSIQHIQITNPGRGYVNGATRYVVNISGDGTGANAYANVANGSFVQIVITNPGQGYTWANVSFPGLANSNTATAKAIMSPIGGHGSYAPREFAAHNIMVSVSTTGDEGGYFSTNNEFRQIGIIRNPTLYGSNTVSNNTLVTMATTFTVAAGYSAFVVDEVVYQGASLSTATFVGTVIDFDQNSNVLRLNNVKGTPSVSTLVNGTNSGAQRYLLSYTLPDLAPYSGDILYIGNMTPISRSTSQTENFKFIIKTT